MPEFSICHFPYTAIQIDGNGDVYPCCHPWCSYYVFGNIFEQSFSEIWNGEKAQEFRKQFINKDYKYCNLDTCINADDIKIKPALIAEKYPKTIELAYDRVCNVQCIFCRDCQCLNQDLSKFDDTMDKWIPDMFRNAERVSISGAGEALASKHSRNLMKKIVQMYPTVKFDILTNGILMNEKNINELGIINNLGYIRFSFHAVNKSTYEKLVKHSDFDKIMKNIQYIASLKRQGKVEQLEFRFVITAINYKEMPTFAQMAKDNGAIVTFLNLIKTSSISENFDELDVTKPLSSHYNDFVKVMQNPIFRENFIMINEELLNLKPIENNSYIKNLYKTIKEKLKR